MVWAVHLLALIIGVLAGFVGFDYILDVLISQVTILEPFLVENKPVVPIIEVLVTIIVYSFSFGPLNKLFVQEGLDPDEIVEMQPPSTLKDLSAGSGYMISKNFRISEDYFKEHIAYIGPTGAGKTTSGYIPNLLDQNVPTGSVIINDIKLDIIGETAKTQMNKGADVLLFAPHMPEHSIRINPLLQVSDTSEIRQLAKAMLVNGVLSSDGNSGDQEWISMASPLLSSVLIAARVADKNPTISKCIKTIISLDDNALERYIQKSGSIEANDMYLLYKQSAKAASTSGGIRTVLGSRMQIFLDPKIEEVTSGNDFHLKSLREKPTALYIHVPETKAQYTMPLTATLYYLLFSSVSTRNGLPVIFLLDEFANLGIIPDFDHMVTVCRGRNVPLVLGIQSPSQLEKLYGKAAETIMDNIKTKVFFPGMGPNSAKYAHEILGKIKYKGKVMDQAAIRQIPENKVIVISRNKAPVVDDSNYYRNNKEYVKLASNLFDYETEFIRAASKGTGFERELSPAPEHNPFDDKPKGGASVFDELDKEFNTDDDNS